MGEAMGGAAQRLGERVRADRGADGAANLVDGVLRGPLTGQDRQRRCWTVEFAVHRLALSLFSFEHMC